MTREHSRSLDQLLARAAAGNERAFEELYDITAARLYGLALQLVREPARAQRVTEDAYTLIWRYCARHDARKLGALPWMSTILHGAARTHTEGDATTLRPDEPGRGRRHVRY